MFAGRATKASGSTSPEAIGETSAAWSWRSRACQRWTVQKALAVVASNAGQTSAESGIWPSAVWWTPSSTGPARWVIPPELAKMVFFTARDCLTSMVSSAMNSLSRAS